MAPTTSVCSTEVAADGRRATLFSRWRRLLLFAGLGAFAALALEAASAPAARADVAIAPAPVEAPALPGSVVAPDPAPAPGDVPPAVPAVAEAPSTSTSTSESGVVPDDPTHTPPDPGAAGGGTPEPVTDPAAGVLPPAPSSSVVDPPPVTGVVDPITDPPVDPVPAADPASATVTTGAPAASDAPVTSGSAITTDTAPVVAPVTAIPAAPPPLLADPGVNSNVAGPISTPADRVIAVIGSLLPTSAGFESVLGVYFVSSSAGGASMLFFPGAPLGTEFAIGGPAWRMLMNAVASSEVAGGFVLVMGPTTGRGRLAACRGGSLVTVFGRLLGRTRVLCLAELTRPGVLRNRLIPQPLIPHLVAVGHLFRSQAVAQSRATRLAAAGLGAARIGIDPGYNPPAGAPAAPAAPVAPAAPTLPVPTTAPAPSPTPELSGSRGGGRTPVSGILATFASLAALMFAGFVRHRQWPPIAPTAQLLASPG